VGPFTFLLWALLPAGPTPESAAQLQHAIERVEARYPPVAANEQAVRLEQLAARIGIDLAPPLPDRAHPLLSEKDIVEKLKLAAYVLAQVESPDSAIGAPPPEVTQYLQERSESLAGIRALLLAGTPPLWAVDLARGKAAEPDPNSTGRIVLQRILLTKALVDARASRASEAALWVEASWRLNESAWARPSMVWQLMAIAAARWEAGVLRKLPDADPVWTTRMRFAPELDRVFGVMNDAFVIGFIEPPDPEELKQWSPMELLSGMAKAVEALQKRDPCSFSRADAEGYWKPYFPGPIEKTLAEIAMPNLGSAARRLYRLRIEGELTARVLDARRVLGGAEPPSAGTSAESPSSVCAGARWSTLAQPGGGAHVHFDGKFEDWTDESGIRPPLEFTIRPAVSAAPTPTLTPAHP